MPTTSVLFKVTGKGDFPADMLRHDKCWPADTTSAGYIAGPLMLPHYVGTKVHEVEQHRTVFLCSESGWGHYSGPTVARWASFGWGCEIIAARCDGEDVTEAVRTCAT